LSRKIEDPKLLTASTIYSNSANAPFEMGNYSGAADDSRNEIYVIQSEGAFPWMMKRIKPYCPRINSVLLVASFMTNEKKH